MSKEKTAKNTIHGIIILRDQEIKTLTDQVDSLVRRLERKDEELIFEAREHGKTKESRNEYMRQVAQLKKVVAALLMPWANVLFYY